MLWPRSLLLLLLATLIHGNTEITNFAASERTDAPLLRGRGWPTLRPRSTTRWTLVRAAYGSPFNAVCASSAESESERCPYELWLALDTPSTYGRWTLRISWPAYMPTDFELEVLDPRAAAALHLIPREVGAPTTTRKYARIRGVDAGVRTPGTQWIPNVHFVLTLEPLIFGVLPESVVPFLLMVIVVVVALILPGGVLERIQNGVEGLVQEAKKEVLEGKKED
ncbi:hypothetical protein C8R45DRAFT_807167 [Mycena sanguinolenta]|nr:hypothetical protein C8R45DRAFT_807167 [Mycena sanguinolenta]